MEFGVFGEDGDGEGHCGGGDDSLDWITMRPLQLGGVEPDSSILALSSLLERVILCVI